ncbi:MAG: hypothetical protein LDLANPLL_01083 [Turneriella sp.]|nr:hypothetical protein [Turneriella sp.]
MNYLRYILGVVVIFTACSNLPVEEATFKAYPNPYNPAQGVLKIEKISAPAFINTNQHDLIVYDYNLTEIYRTQVTPNGSGQIFWGGIESNGTSVAPGVYYIKVVVTTPTKVEGTNEMLKIIVQ